MPYISILLALVVWVSLTGCADPSGSALCPPVPEVAARAIAHPAFRWDSLATSRATVYTQPGSYAAERREELADDVDAAITHALEVLGEPTYSEHLRVFFVGSRDEMAALAGRGSTGVAHPEQPVVFLVVAPNWRPFTRHEVFHAVSLHVWGQPLGATDLTSVVAGGWLREGLATAAEGQCAGHPLRAIVAAARRERSMIPVDTLAATFYDLPDPDAYLQAGSLLEFVQLRYGTSALRQLWDDGLDAFPRATGVTADEAEVAWHAWLDGASARNVPDPAVLRDVGCG